MRGLRDNEVLLLTVYDVIVISPLAAFQASFHYGFWKREHDFPIVIQRNFIWDAWFPRLRAKYDVIVIYPLYAISQDGFWKSDHDFLIAFHIVTFYLRCMVSEITMFYCKPDMTSSWLRRQGALNAILHDGFWKSDHDLLIVFHSNFLSGMHGFRDNEVLLQGGYDVIVISPLGGTSGNFSWRILKERPWLPDSVPYKHFI